MIDGCESMYQKGTLSLSLSLFIWSLLLRFRSDRPGTLQGYGWCRRNVSRSKEFFRSNEKKGESKGKKFCGGRLWPRESRVLTGHRKLKEGESHKTCSCCGVPDICNCPPSSIAFAVGSFFFFFFCFLRLFLFCFLFCFQWAGPGVVRVVLHVDRVTSAIVNGYPFSSFSFCATWKRAKKTKQLKDSIILVRCLPLLPGSLYIDPDIGPCKMKRHRRK